LNNITAKSPAGIYCMMMTEETFNYEKGDIVGRRKQKWKKIQNQEGTGTMSHHRWKDKPNTIGKCDLEKFMQPPIHKAMNINSYIVGVYLF